MLNLAQKHHPGCHIRLLVMDEARFGLHNQTGKKLTNKGIKPVAPRQQSFEWSYVYTALDPIDGQQFSMLATHADTACMNVYLHELAQTYPQDIIFMLLDNAGWHRAKTLIIPENMILWNLPAYSPELNPVERFWLEIRRSLKNRVFQSLEELENEVCKAISSFKSQDIISIAAYPYLISAINQMKL